MKQRRNSGFPLHFNYSGARSAQKWYRTSQTQSLSPSADLPLARFLPGPDGKALQFLKRRRAQSQISARVLIWPPNGIIQTQAFITHINERAGPGHPCSGTHPPNKSKDGWKSSGLKGGRQKKGKTASCNPLLFPSLPSSASICFCSHQLLHSVLIRPLFGALHL